jgi:hypothetical protein
MGVAWCDVEWGSALSTCPPVTRLASRDRVGRPEASLAPGSRYEPAITLPPLSTKSAQAMVQLQHPQAFFCLWRAASDAGRASPS